MAVTIQDVAKAAQVSVPVVSTVLHGSKGNTRVSAATRQRVIDIAKSLNYRPHFASRSLARKRSDTIGIFIPPGQWRGLGYGYEGAVLQGVESVCREKGFDLLAINLQGAQEPEHCLNKFAEQRIDGLLLLHLTHDAPWINGLCAAHSNIATINYHGAARNLDIINFDNEAAVRTAIRHLAGLGHRRIGYIGSMSADGPDPEALLRCAGFRRAILEQGLALKDTWVLDTPNTAFMDEINRLPFIDRFLRAATEIAALRRNGPTAWLAHNDLVAGYTMKHLHRRRLRVPRDLSVVGVDNSEVAQLLDPPLTSVSQPLFDMGALAANRLIDRVGLPPAKPRHILHQSPPRLVRRESCAAPRSVKTRPLTSG